MADHGREVDGRSSNSSSSRRAPRVPPLLLPSTSHALSATARCASLTVAHTVPRSAQVAVRLQGAFAQSQIGIHSKDAARERTPGWSSCIHRRSWLRPRVLGGIGVGRVARLLPLVGPHARARPTGSRARDGARLGVAMRRGRVRRVELPGGVDAAALGAGAYSPALATSVARAREYVPLYPAKRKHP